MFRITTACLWTIAALLVASAPSYAQATAFRDVRLFDGTGVHERTTVVVSDGRIVTVSPDSEIPTGAMVVDTSRWKSVSTLAPPTA